MRVLIAPDKFRGSLTSRNAAEAIARGIVAADKQAEVDLCPMSDGGEGFVDVMLAALGGQTVACRVTGPLAEMKVDARFGMLADGTTAIIEMAAASGLSLLRPEQYDPLATTTFGTGQLICRAAEMGVLRIVLGIGGSATIDAGIGCAQACGLPVILEDGQTVSPGEPLCGRDVQRVELIKRGRGSKVDAIKFEVGCDAAIVLSGAHGAAITFGAQKGADSEVIEQLDAALAQLATRCGKMDEAKLPGAGAAGGLGFGMAAFFGATLRPGFEIVAEAVRLSDRIARCDLCITGEGRFDAGSEKGKVVGRLARCCAEAAKPCIALCGAVADDAAGIEGLTRAIAIGIGSESPERFARTADDLQAAARQVLLEL
jgi:glycerate 2-kinase